MLSSFGLIEPKLFFHDHFWKDFSMKFKKYFFCETCSDIYGTTKVPQPPVPKNHPGGCVYFLTPFVL